VSCPCELHQTMYAPGTHTQSGGHGRPPSVRTDPGADDRRRRAGGQSPASYRQPDMAQERGPRREQSRTTAGGAKKNPGCPTPNRDGGLRQPVTHRGPASRWFSRPARPAASRMGRPDRRPGRGRQPGHLADDCDGPCARPAGTGKRVSRPGRGRAPVLARSRASRQAPRCSLSLPAETSCRRALSERRERLTGPVGISADRAVRNPLGQDLVATPSNM
jgi:hypothetical protein